MTDFYRYASQRKETADYRPLQETVSPAAFSALAVETPVRAGRAPGDLRLGRLSAVAGDEMVSAYFLRDNIQIVQNGIRRKVFDLSGGKYNIPEPNATQLMMAMDDVFERFVARFPPDVTAEIERLNAITVAAAAQALIRKLDYNEHFQAVHLTVRAPITNPVAVDRDSNVIVQMMGRQKCAPPEPPRADSYVFGRGQYRGAGLVGVVP